MKILRKNGQAIGIVLFIVSLLSLCGCNGESEQAVKPAPEPSVLRQFPPKTLYLAQESDTVETADRSGVDYGNASDGYVMAWYSGAKCAKIQVIKVDSNDDSKNPTWNYDVDASGVKEVLPLQAGSGKYKVYVAEQVEGERYSPLVMVEFDATIHDELSPFLYATKYAMVSTNSASVKMAYEQIGRAHV